MDTIRVYPRACGEIPEKNMDLWRILGLSPRMRGNRRAKTKARQSDGSIPAHAGKSAKVPNTSVHSRVYPRACGEIEHRRRILDGALGLSPRMRGNPSQFLRATI